MVFLLHFVQVSHFDMYANCAGWQCLIQISLKCRGSHASKMACLSCCNETSSTGELGRERAWFVRKHQEERRKPEILLKCRKLCVHATVLPCVFDDLKNSRHCFIFLWILECPYPDFSRQGNIWSTHGYAELDGWCLGRRDELHFFEIRTETGMEEITQMWNISRHLCRNIDCSL